MPFIEDPITAPPLRWGIIGPGRIASLFAQAVQAHTRQQIVAVGSRSQERAEEFRSRFHILTDHSSYEDLVNDPHVDVVYIATPHSEHYEQALLAIKAGKHVLVEKAFARNTTEAREMIEAAHSAGVFIMEAMWMRFLPHITTAKRIVDSGDLGQIIAIEADHGQYFPFDATNRLYDPGLAGGALLDLGVYPISLAHFILGAPDSVHATGTLTQTGVDGQMSVILPYGAQTQAAIHTTLWARTPTRASIAGVNGRIEIDSRFLHPSSVSVKWNSGNVDRYEFAIDGGLQYEAAEVARRIDAGDVESDVMSHAGTLAVMATMDEARRQVGVVFPGE